MISEASGTSQDAQEKEAVEEVQARHFMARQQTTPR
jgi:hypothetical protein